MQQWPRLHISHPQMHIVESKHRKIQHYRRIPSSNVSKKLITISINSKPCRHRSMFHSRQCEPLQCHHPVPAGRPIFRQLLHWHRKVLIPCVLRLSQGPSLQSRIPGSLHLVHSLGLGRHCRHLRLSLAGGQQTTMDCPQSHPQMLLQAHGRHQGNQTSILCTQARRLGGRRRMVMRPLKGPQKTEPLRINRHLWTGQSDPGWHH